MRLYPVSTIRTNNFNDSDMPSKFISAWSDAYPIFTENNLEVYGIFYNYDSNYKGDYNFTVAVPTPTGNNPIEIPNNIKYKKFSVYKDGDRDAELNVWNAIWKLEDEGKITRLYGVDYVHYKTDNTITIYVGVK